MMTTMTMMTSGNETDKPPPSSGSCELKMVQETNRFSEIVTNRFSEIIGNSFPKEVTKRFSRRRNGKESIKKKWQS